MGRVALAAIGSLLLGGGGAEAEARNAPSWSSIPSTGALTRLVDLGGDDGALSSGGALSGGASVFKNPWDSGLEASAPCLATRCTWQRTVGGQFEDKAHAVADDGAGGSFIVGASRGVGPYHDAWAMRANRSGETIWRRSFGGRMADQFFGVVGARDGGMVAVGHTRSSGAGQSDLWVVRLDAQGRTLWTQTFGGPENDRARAVTRTRDGSFVVVGFTASFGAGDRDLWAVKVNDAGRLVWARTFGGPKADYGFDVTALADGGVAIVGHEWTDAKRGRDFLVMRLDADGRPVWRRRLDRSPFDAGTAIAQGADGLFTVVGATRGASAFDDDVWTVRLDGAGVVLWDRVIGGPKPDTPFAVTPLGSGDVAIAAITWSWGAGAGDAWLLRLGPRGDTRWQRVFGGPVWDRPTGLLTTDDDGVLMVGHTSSRGAGYEDGWLLRVDRDGAL